MTAPLRVVKVAGVRHDPAPNAILPEIDPDRLKAFDQGEEDEEPIGRCEVCGWEHGGCRHTKGDRKRFDRFRKSIFNPARSRTLNLPRECDFCKALIPNPVNSKVRYCSKLCYQRAKTFRQAQRTIAANERTREFRHRDG